MRNARVAPLGETFEDLRQMLRRDRILNYKVVQTETADAQIRKIILYVAENFGRKLHLKNLKN